MRISIFSDPTGPGLGGGELCVAELASALNERHDVTLFVRHPADRFTRQAVQECFGVDVGPVELIHWPEREGESRKGREARLRDVSAGFDLFIWMGHGRPPRSYARRSIAYVYFPMFQPAEAWPWCHRPANAWKRLAHAMRCKYYYLKWRRDMASYDTFLGCSQFAAQWIRRRWGVSAETVYPPVALGCSSSSKTTQIATVGRITPMKRHRELAAAFGRMQSRAADWRFIIAGSRDKPDYLAELRATVPTGVEICEGLSRRALADVLDASAIYWHGAGLGIDAERCPDEVEHFGIATVEAMSYGCVPVAPRKGGQLEIVRDGANGFLYDTVEELVDRTLVLTANAELRRELSQAALRTASQFTADAFRRNLLRYAGLPTASLNAADAAPCETAAACTS